MKNTKIILLLGLIIGSVSACSGSKISTSNALNSTNNPLVENVTNKEQANNSHESFSPLLTSRSVNIYAIANCGVTPMTNPRNIVLLDNISTINGDAWNHIDDSSGDTWQGLTKQANQYNINRHPNGQDANCNQAPTYHTILVKKYGDWAQQHANGYFIKTKEKARFLDLDTIIMDIYYDSRLSTLPSTKDIAQTYPSIPKEQLAQWDEGLFQLKIQLMNNSRTYHAAINLALSADMADKWLRVEVPVKYLTTWRSEGYTKFDADLSEFSDQLFHEISFVAETKNLKVYRNYNKKGFDVDKTPKLFKEIAFRIKRLEVTTN